jgi:hypothetical protein
MLKGEHPLAILRRPEQLRARVIQEYGFARFVERVAGHLEELGLKTAQTETAQR